MKTHLLQFAGLLHFAILTASAQVPRVLDWRTVLLPLPRLVRQLFWVYGVFIVLTIIGFGALTLGFAHTLAEGSPLARGLCALVAAFWCLRLAVQAFVFDVRPYLTRPWMRWGYHALTLCFLYFTLLYGACALWPGEIAL